MLVGLGFRILIMTDLNKSKIFNTGNKSSQTVYMIKDVNFATTRLYVSRGLEDPIPRLPTAEENTILASHCLISLTCRSAMLVVKHKRMFY